MIEVRDFQPSDAFAIELRPQDSERAVVRDSREWKDIVDKSVAYTLLYDDEILCCGGVCFYRKRFGEAWILCSRKAEEHPIATFRTARRVIDDIMKLYDMYRVQATVQCDWFEAQRFIKLLGFKWEGTLWRYGPDGSNYQMYSRIK